MRDSNAQNLYEKAIDYWKKDYKNFAESLFWEGYKLNDVNSTIVLGHLYYDINPTKSYELFNIAVKQNILIHNMHENNFTNACLEPWFPKLTAYLLQKYALNSDSDIKNVNVTKDEMTVIAAISYKCNAKNVIANIARAKAFGIGFEKDTEKAITLLEKFINSSQVADEIDYAKTVLVDIYTDEDSPRYDKAIQIMCEIRHSDIFDKDAVLEIISDTIEAAGLGNKTIDEICS